MDPLPLAQLAANSRPYSAMDGISSFFLRNGLDLDSLMEQTPAKNNLSPHPEVINGRIYV